MRVLLPVLVAMLLVPGCLFQRATPPSTETRYDLDVQFVTTVPGTGEAGRRLDLRPTCAGPNDPLLDCAMQPAVWSPVGNASTRLSERTNVWWTATVRDCNIHTAHFGVRAAGASASLVFSFSRSDRLQVEVRQGELREPSIRSTEMWCETGV